MAKLGLIIVIAAAVALASCSSEQSSLLTDVNIEAVSTMETVK